MAGVAGSISDMDYEKQRAIMGALGAGAKFGVLMPFSRNHESEADHIGLIYMARAGYDPQESIRFWKRMENAEAGIAALSAFVDALIVIPNERLKMVSETRITMKNAFEIADGVLGRGVMSVSELITAEAEINLDFADVTSIMKDAGLAHMGVGYGKGKDKADLAAKMAISSPLLETSISGAKGIIINIFASPDIGMEDIDYASQMISSEANPDANVIWGLAFDENLDDEMKITVIATGFDKSEQPAAKAAAAPAEAARTQDAASSGDKKTTTDEFDAIIDILRNSKNNVL
jgi:cell division protein FtsZ